MKIHPEAGTLRLSVYIIVELVKAEAPIDTVEDEEGKKVKILGLSANGGYELGMIVHDNIKEIVAEHVFYTTYRNEIRRAVDAWTNDKVEAADQTFMGGKPYPNVSLYLKKEMPSD